MKKIVTLLSLLTLTSVASAKDLICRAQLRNDMIARYATMEPDESKVLVGYVANAAVAGFTFYAKINSTGRMDLSITSDAKDDAVIASAENADSLDVLVGEGYTARIHCGEDF